MITDKALYWMAVGLVALVAGNHLVSRFDSHCLGQRTMAVVERLSGGPVFAAILDNTSAQCVRAQTGFAKAQTTMARHEAGLARLQAERDRLMAVQQLQQMRLQIVAPTPNLRLAIPEIAVRPVRISLNDDNL